MTFQWSVSFQEFVEHKKVKMGNSESSKMEKAGGPLMVAAIDFGSTFSGYAFSMSSSPEDIKLNKNWGEDVGSGNYKAPTSVLVNSKGNFVSFGYEAEQKYAQSCIKGKMEEYELFKNFKMMLYHETNLKISTKIKSLRGKEHNALSIFAMAISYLKDHLLQAVKKMYTHIDEELIKWVLTIPAIWDEPAKQFMREAALEAGLITSKDSDRLLLALEPEAASIFCRSLEINNFNGDIGRQNMELKFETGTKYMIIDVGGGTADITAHEIQSDGRMSELMSANGGDWGGNRVNENFEELLSKVLGKQFVGTFKAEHPTHWLKLMDDYENKKREIEVYSNDGMLIAVTTLLRDSYKVISKKTFAEVIEQQPEEGVEFNRGNLNISIEAVQQMFDPVTDKIVQHVETTVKQNKLCDIKFIFLVGGFSRSSYLIQRMKEKFENRYLILSPNEASVAVLKGAVAFGHNPSVVASRVARKTYGVGISKKFVKGRHSDAKKYIKADGTEMAQDVFEPYVVKGKQIPINSFSSYTFSSGSRFNEIIIYSSDSENVIHTDDPCNQKVGILSLRMSWWKRSYLRYLQNRVFFGQTEITAELEDKDAGKVVRTTLNFLQE